MKIIDTDFGSFTLSDDFDEWLDKLDPNWREVSKDADGRIRYSPVVTKLGHEIVDVVQRIFSPALGR
jgi:hypothetical protein